MILYEVQEDVPVELPSREGHDGYVRPGRSTSAYAFGARLRNNAIGRVSGWFPDTLITPT